MLKAVRVWLINNHKNYPGWKEWQKKKIAHTLHFDDPFLPDKLEDGFIFSDDIEKQHAVIMGYLHLHGTLHSFQDCEFYFRRYPFHGLPISRYQHITNVCEMYFSKVYQFKERLKEYFKALGAVTPDNKLEVGRFIKTFSTTFDQELRERNITHHHQDFRDIAIDRVFLLEIGSEDKGWKQEQRIAYRKLVDEWVRHVRDCSVEMEKFLEDVAAVTLSNCSFLSIAENSSH